MYVLLTILFVCEGMRESKEFALELFDALSRRRRLKVEKISREELYEYWSQITDQSFDSRLQIFFDMYVYVNELLLFAIKINISSICLLIIVSFHNNL